MELNNFGSILNFAIECEAADQAFYRSAAANPACAPAKALFEDLAADSKKGEQNMARTRRENVTEMILEHVSGFHCDPFMVKREDVGALSLKDALARASEIEDKAACFYTEAAAKLKTLQEVSRLLGRAAQKRADRKKKVEAAKA